ncbi:MAG: lipoate--protein ligase family protein, partial [Alcaligenaceae bacterium]|nr:lipoate--protein ligase family protein [Alcaligenaceae bacterium]
MSNSASFAADTSGLPLLTPARFTLLDSSAETGADARHDESLLELAARRGPLASIWQTQRSLVVPRSYRRFEAFEQAQQHFATQGWPVTVRQTGGGIVPQGPGILNLSLAYPVQGPPMRHSEPGYLLICRILAHALLSIGVEAFPAAVAGSFCDGRYNLAVNRQGMAVKIAGTAQSWRRVPGSADEHMGLVHALVL